MRFCRCILGVAYTFVLVLFAVLRVPLASSKNDRSEQRYSCWRKSCQKEAAPERVLVVSKIRMPESGIWLNCPLLAGLIPMKQKESSGKTT